MTPPRIRVTPGAIDPEVFSGALGAWAELSGDFERAMRESGGLGETIASTLSVLRPAAVVAGALVGAGDVVLDHLARAAARNEEYQRLSRAWDGLLANLAVSALRSNTARGLVGLAQEGFRQTDAAIERLAREAAEALGIVIPTHEAVNASTVDFVDALAVTLLATARGVGDLLWTSATALAIVARGTAANVATFYADIWDAPTGGPIGSEIPRDTFIGTPGTPGFGGSLEDVHDRQEFERRGFPYSLPGVVERIVTFPPIFGLGPATEIPIVVAIEQSPELREHIAQGFRDLGRWLEPGPDGVAELLNVRLGPRVAQVYRRLLDRRSWKVGVGFRSHVDEAAALFTTVGSEMRRLFGVAQRASSTIARDILDAQAAERAALEDARLFFFGWAGRAIVEWAHHERLSGIGADLDRALEGGVSSIEGTLHRLSRMFDGLAQTYAEPAPELAATATGAARLADAFGLLSGLTIDAVSQAGIGEEVLHRARMTVEGILAGVRAAMEIAEGVASILVPPKAALHFAAAGMFSVAAGLAFARAGGAFAAPRPRRTRDGGFELAGPLRAGTINLTVTGPGVVVPDDEWLRTHLLGPIASGGRSVPPTRRFSAPTIPRGRELADLLLNFLPDTETALDKAELGLLLLDLIRGSAGSTGGIGAALRGWALDYFEGNPGLLESLPRAVIEDALRHAGAVTGGFSGGFFENILDHLGDFFGGNLFGGLLGGIFG